MNSAFIYLLPVLIAGGCIGWLLAAMLNARANSARANELSTLTERARALQERLQLRDAEFVQIETAALAARAESLRLATELSAATTALHSERENAVEKLQLLERTREEMTLRFRQLSQEILEDKSRRFTEQNQLNLEQILQPLREKISGFEQQVKQTYEFETRDRIALKEQIAQLAQLNQKVSAEANNLAVALRGESKTQGNWGEMILERILELSGLENGREYETQFSARDGEGDSYRPDAIVHLPGGRDIVVDAKVSLTAYTRVSEAMDESARAAALAEHVASVRAHIAKLGRKNYHALQGLGSLDFVLMFIPSEAAYIEAAKADPRLYETALAQNIGLVCPSTLLPTLRTVENLWKMERQSNNAKAIAEEAGKLYDKFIGFEQDLSKLGKALNTANEAYRDARSKLVDGSGNLVRKVQALKKMGAKTTKQLPESLLNEALPDSSESEAGE